MRLNRLILLLTLLMAPFVAAQEKYVSPKRDGVGLYKNEIRKLYEEPVVKLGPNDRLLVLDAKRYHFKVQHADGTVGWVEKQVVETTTRSKQYVFENADVYGYLDNPTPVYILDTDDPNANPINLDRSFKDALRENVDRETVERQSK